MSTKDKNDDLEAVRKIVEALDGFEPSEQERIIRWAREKVGLAPAPASQSRTAHLQDRESMDVRTPPSAVQMSNIKTFIESKNPQSDRQFAAAVAYFY